MEPSDRAFLMLGARIVGDFGVTIAVPAVIAGLLGHAVDVRWGTKPWALVGCLVVAFTVTALIINRKAKAYGREYQQLINKNQKP